MTGVARNLTAIVALGWVAGGFAADREMGNSATQQQENIQVLDVVIVSTNRVTLGTNTMSLAAAANLIRGYRDTLDIIAVHESVSGAATTRATSSAIADLARGGIPLVIVEKDGAYSWREESGSEGVRTVKVGTDQFLALHRLWRTGKQDAATATGPLLQTRVDWDTATGTYELRGVELGLLGKRVWLFHEPRETDETSGTLGLQIRTEW